MDSILISARAGLLVCFLSFACSLPAQEPDKKTLVLELQIRFSNSLEIHVKEGEPFRVVTRKNGVRYVVAGEVEQIVDGIASVRLETSVKNKGLYIRTSSPELNPLKLKIDQYQPVGNGSLRFMVTAWIRSSEDPTSLMVKALAQRDERSISAISYLGNRGWESRGAVPDLLEILVGPDHLNSDRQYDSLKRHSAIALGKIADEKNKNVTDALKTASLDTNEYVRVAAARARWQISKDPKAIPDLIKNLSSQNYDIRLTAASNLGEIGPDAKESLDALTGALQDSDGGVRLQAAYALGKLGDSAKNSQDVITSLNELALEDSKTEVRSAAKHALEQLK